MAVRIYGAVLGVLVLGVALSPAAGQSTATVALQGGVPVNAKLFGLNDVLGPIQAIEYSDPVLCEAIQSLGVGLLRYPGGTVANYWNMTAGQYVPTCDGHCSCCKFNTTIAEFPPATFSAAQFSAGVAQCTGSKVGMSLVNVLTMDTAETIAQLHTLAATSAGQSLLEVGNELYLNNYKWRFTDGQSYMEAALPVISAARTILPNTSIAVVGSLSELDKGWVNDSDEAGTMAGSSWNGPVAQYADMYDAITLHDYSLSSTQVEHLSETEQKEYVAAYSQAIVERLSRLVPQQFSKTTKVYMTEYNLGIKHPPLPSLLNGGLHGIFVVSRIMAGVNNHQVFGALQYHVLASVSGVAWDSHTGVWYAPSAQPANLSSTQVNGVGQLFAHISRVGLASSMMHPASITGGGSMGVKVKGATMPCLQAAGFSTSSTATVVVLNRCDSHNVTTTMQLPAPVTSCRITTYWAADEGGFAPMPSPSVPVPWTTGPLHAWTRSAAPDEGGRQVTASLEGIAVHFLTCGQ